MSASASGVEHDTLKRRHASQKHSPEYNDERDLKSPEEKALYRGQTRQLQQTAWQQYKHLALPVAFTMLSFITRFWSIGKSNIVVWDEAHFGKVCVSLDSAAMI